MASALLTLIYQKESILNERDMEYFLRENKNPIMGALTSLASMPILSMVNQVMRKILEVPRGSYNEYLNEESIAIFREIFKEGLLKSDLSPLVKGVLKGGFMAYFVVVKPICDELLFRRWIYQETLKWQVSLWGIGCLNDLSLKVSRIVINGLLFGAFCALPFPSPFRGWDTTISIFVLNGIMGVILTTLREFTDGTSASSTAHIVHNALICPQGLV